MLLHRGRKTERGGRQKDSSWYTWCRSICLHRVRVCGNDWVSVCKRSTRLELRPHLREGKNDQLLYFGGGKGRRIGFNLG